MKQLHFTFILISTIFILGCSNSEEHYVVPNDNDIASYLKLMPVESVDILNPTGNKKLSDDIKEQKPFIKI